jgi:hypothetical protein
MNKTNPQIGSRFADCLIKEAIFEASTAMAMAKKMYTSVLHLTDYLINKIPI